MDSQTLMKFAIGGAVLFGIYKLAPAQWMKAMALGAAGVAVAKQIPYVNEIV